MPPHQRFSHWTADVLLGLRLTEGGTWWTDTTARRDLAVITPHRAPRRHGIRGREIQSSAKVWTLHNGLRVTPPVDTRTQLAREMSIDDWIVMGDGLVGRKGPRATMPELVAVVERSTNRTGSARLRGFRADSGTVIWSTRVRGC